MPSITLSLSDPALREAVIEQLMAAKLPAPNIADTSAAVMVAIKTGRENLIISDHNILAPKIAQTLNAIDDQDRPTLLRLGAADDAESVDETFAKPIRLGHLITRIRYYLETAPLLHNKMITFGPYRLEPQKRCVFRNGCADPIRLTEKEAALLVYLAQNQQPATRQDLLAAVWGYDERIDTHTLETHIYQLRRKFEATGKDGDDWLINEAGAYRLAGSPKI